MHNNKLKKNFLEAMYENYETMKHIPFLENYENVCVSYHYSTWNCDIKIWLMEKASHKVGMWNKILKKHVLLPRSSYSTKTPWNMPM